MRIDLTLRTQIVPRPLLIFKRCVVQDLETNLVYLDAFLYIYLHPSQIWRVLNLAIKSHNFI
jgi:hypothetical protein